ncbi:MAG: hypothetical protein MUO42_05605 [Anaerolineaceae bacterium]|nr:hypothetical protein [Anaerolineaceae bacterium]
MPGISISHDSGEIDPNCMQTGLNRSNLLGKNSQPWLKINGLSYHSNHKFRHGHVHYGQARSKTQEDYKAVSQNVMHSTTGITDQFYSNIDDEEKKIKIDSMFDNQGKKEDQSEEYEEFLEFLAWKKASNQ